MTIKNKIIVFNIKLKTNYILLILNIEINFYIYL